MTDVQREGWQQKYADCKGQFYEEREAALAQLTPVQLELLKLAEAAQEKVILNFWLPYSFDLIHMG